MIETERTLPASMNKRPIRRKSQKIQEKESPLFGRQNYLLMALGAFLIFAGFLIMGLEMEIEGFWSLFVSPWLILGGFVTFGYGLIRKNPELENGQEKPA